MQLFWNIGGFELEIMSTNKNGDLLLLQCEPQEMKLRVNGIPMSSYMNY